MNIAYVVPGKRVAGPPVRTGKLGLVAYYLLTTALLSLIRIFTGGSHASRR